MLRNRNEGYEYWSICRRLYACKLINIKRGNVQVGEVKRAFIAAYLAQTFLSQDYIAILEIGKRGLRNMC